MFHRRQYGLNLSLEYTYATEMASLNLTTELTANI